MKTQKENIKNCITNFYKNKKSKPKDQIIGYQITEDEKEQQKNEK